MDYYATIIEDDNGENVYYFLDVWTNVSRLIKGRKTKTKNLKEKIQERLICGFLITVSMTRMNNVLLIKS